MPDALVGEVHQDSNPFSAATWQVYSTLDATKQQAFQRAWLKGLTMVPTGSLGYGDLTEILVAAITSDLDAATGDALKQSYESRGMKKGDPRVRPWTGAPFRSVDPQVPFFALGTSTVGGGVTLSPGVFQVRYDSPAGGTVTFHASFTAYAPASGGSPFGGNGTPFKPVLLAKASDTPITFKYGPFSHDATQGTCTISGSSGSCSVELHVAGTAGTTAPVHLMIGSTGQQDGYYDALSVTNDPIVPDAPPPPADAGTDAAAADAPTAPTSSSGCACELAARPGETSTSGALGAVAALALMLTRRRR